MYTMVEDRYRRINFIIPEYRPKRDLAKKSLAKIAKKILPKKWYAHIRRAEELIFSYNKECCRLAPFVYSIAKCAKRINEGTIRSNGIAMSKDKRDFCVDRFKKLYSTIVDRRNHIRQRLRHKIFIMICTFAFIMVWMIGLLLYPLIESTLNTRSTFPNSFYIIFGISFSAFFCFIGASIFIYSILYLERQIVQKMRTTIAKDYPKYFAIIYKTLHFEQKKENEFLYTLEPGEADVKKIYQLTRNIYVSHEARIFSPQKQSSDPLIEKLHIM